VFSKNPKTDGDSGKRHFTTVDDGGPPADTTPPTAPDNLRVIDRTTSSITIAWNASTDDSGITGHDIQMKRVSDGTYSIIGSTNETSFTATGLQSSATYYFQLRAEFKVTMSAGDRSFEGLEYYSNPAWILRAGTSWREC
jgi:hypothetical protein